MFLSRDELVELTGKKQCAAQTRALRYMGIEHKIRPDGTVAVAESHVKKEFCGIPNPANIPQMRPLTWGEIK